MKYLLWMILGFHFLVTDILFANEKLLSLVEAERALVIEDRSSSDYFLCQMENKKVFGRNPAKTSECYSLNEQNIEISLQSFLSQPSENEIQIGFFTAEGKQIFPYWEEGGGRFLLQSYVIASNAKLFVQAVRKDTKQYFYWRTLPAGWMTAKQ